MSNLQFASLRHEISHHVHAANEPLKLMQLFEVCKMTETYAQLTSCIFEMCKAGELDKIPAPAGSGQGVRFFYGPGKNKPGAEPQENDTGGGDPKAEGTRQKAQVSNELTQPSFLLENR